MKFQGWRLEILDEFLLATVHLFDHYLLISDVSASLNVTSEWSNPLVGANVTWTKEMATDLQRRYNEAETFLVPCLWVSKPSYSGMS